MLDKEYAVNMLTALIDGTEEMNGHGIKAKCLAVNDAVFDTIRSLVTYLQNSEEVVRCENCKHRPYKDKNGNVRSSSWDDETCPCTCDDSYYNWMPEDDFFCGKGERREDEID